MTFLLMCLLCGMSFCAGLITMYAVGERPSQHDTTWRWRMRLQRQIRADRRFARSRRTSN